MGFDLASVMSQAKSAVDGGGSGGGGSYKYRLLYPGVGTTKVKMLFNPASNMLMRLINRHTYSDDKVPCLRTIGKECPICKAIEDVKNAADIDLGKYRSIARGIAFAQFLEANYEVQNISKGDVVLLMFPWTVYQQISQQIDDNKNKPENLEKMMASNTGFAFNITHSPDHKYNTQIDAFSQYTTCESDEEFNNLLMGLETLNEQMVPSNFTEPMLHDIRDVAAEIRSKYLNAPGVAPSTPTSIMSGMTATTPAPTQQTIASPMPGSEADVPF